MQIKTFWAVLFATFSINSCLECTDDPYLGEDLYSRCKINSSVPIDKEAVRTMVVVNSDSSGELYSKLNLRMYYMNIEKIEPEAFVDLKRLERLMLNNNRLSQLTPGIFNGLSKLKYLHLSNNILTRISEGAFNGLEESLEELDLSFNLISDIDRDGFSNLEKLENLDLSNNNLTVLKKDLFKDLKKILRIDVNRNPLKEVQELVFSHSIIFVTFTFSDLKDFNFSVFKTSIEYIDLSLSNLEKIDFEQLKVEVETLQISKTKIHTIKNLNLAKVRQLYLRHNKITDLESLPEQNCKKANGSQDLTDPCFKVSSLQHLSLENNQITIVKENSLAGCPNLDRLYLSNNKIETIEQNAFSKVPLLTTLELSGNNLKNLNFDKFSGLQKLESFYFDGNQITDFDVDALVKTCPKLKHIKLKNPISCENLINIFKKLRIYHIESYDLKFAKCTK